MNIVQLNTTAPDNVIVKGNGGGNSSQLKQYFCVIPDKMFQDITHGELSAADCKDFVENYSPYPMYVGKDKDWGSVFALQSGERNISQDAYGNIISINQVITSPFYDEDYGITRWRCFGISYDYLTQEGNVIEYYNPPYEE